MRNSLKTLGLLSVISLISAFAVTPVRAGDIVREAIDKTSQDQYRVYQIDIQNMGLGLYGGPAYNQGYRSRDGWAAGVALYKPAWTDGGTSGNLEARLYLADQLAAMGLSVQIQGLYRNVVAELRGSERPGDIYIISAHYDTTSVGERPGGDDNASGTAGVLEAARVLSQYNPAATLRFIGFNAEEDWMLGSQDYVDQVVLPGKERIMGVLNLDMIIRPGWDSNPLAPVDLDIETSSNKACTAWARVFMDVVAAYVPTLKVDPTSPNGFYWDAGDQGPFISANSDYPALMIAENTASEIWWYGCNAYYHQPADADDAAANNPLSPSGITYDYGFATDVVRATIATIAKEAAVKAKPAPGFFEYQAVATRGARAVEPFTIGEDQYLAIANSRDDLTWQADVTTYKWDGSVFVKQQSIPSQGAADCRFFSIGDAHYLAVANLRDDTTYRVDSKLYRWDGAGFVQQQALSTTGAAGFASFTIGGGTYLAVANSRTDAGYDANSTIYRWNGTKFSEFQSIPTTGAADCEFFTIDDVPYLAIANAQNDDTHDVNSCIYRWDGTRFAEFQTIATQGAADWEALQIGGVSYLVVANGHGDEPGQVDSRMYKWDGSRFAPHQLLPTRGAVHWASLSLGKDVWLAVANSRDGVTCDAGSVVYKWNGARFVESLSLPTHGAAGTAFFRIGETPFLAIANGQTDATHGVASAIYRYQMPPSEDSEN
jgi:hypothetical protein